MIEFVYSSLFAYSQLFILNNGTTIWKDNCIRTLMFSRHSITTVFFVDFRMDWLHQFIAMVTRHASIHPTLLVRLWELLHLQVRRNYLRVCVV